MSSTQYSEFRKEFLECATGYFNVPNYLSDSIQPVVSGSVWSVLTAIWRHTVGYQRWEAKLSITYLEKITGLSKPTVINSLKVLSEGNLIIAEKEEVGIGKRWGKGKKEDLMKKYGGSASLIKINLEAVKILYWLEKAAVKNLYWYQLKSFTGMGLKPVKNLYPLKTINKNIKNTEDFSPIAKKQEEEYQIEGAKILRNFLNKIKNRNTENDLNENSENVSLFGVDKLKEIKDESE